MWFADRNSNFITVDNVISGLYKIKVRILQVTQIS